MKAVTRLESRREGSAALTTAGLGAAVLGGTGDTCAGVALCTFAEIG